MSLFLKSNVDPAMSESDKDDEVNFYLTIFGWMQIFCLLVAPAIGQVLDRNLSNAIDDPQLGDKSVEEGTIFRRVQSLQNTRNAYLITQVRFHLIFKILNDFQGLFNNIRHYVNHSRATLLSIHYLHFGDSNENLFALDRRWPLRKCFSFCTFGQADRTRFCLWCSFLLTQ